MSLNLSLMLRGIVMFVAATSIVYIGLCTYLYFYQRSMIYYPQARSPGTSEPTIMLSTDAGHVLVTARPHSGPDALIYFGGNAEDVSSSLPGLSAAFPDHAIFLLHYRGYGGSPGSPSEAALFADATALFDKVRIEHQNIVAVGRSLGSGVAVHLASVRPVSRLVLVTPYNSIQELAALQFPYFPVRWLLQDKFESWRYAEQVTVPTVVIVAEHDEVVPRVSTQALYAHFREGVASLKVVAGADHNTITDSAEYITLLRGSHE